MSKVRKGRHKARVFLTALGITSENAEWLREILLIAVKQNEAAESEIDLFERRYTVDFQLITDVGEAMVRSDWIILHAESFPRLTTCDVLKRGK